MAKGDRKRPHTPHPLLTRPVLYFADVPEYVTWKTIVSITTPVGNARSGGRSITADGRLRWKVQFDDILHAEMALATLQQRVVRGWGQRADWTLKLSHTSTLDSAIPDEPLCRQYIKGDTSLIQIEDITSQDIFTWFRAAGPLVYAKDNVHVGQRYQTWVVQYWYEKDADFARQNYKRFHYKFKVHDSLSLRTFSPYSIVCRNLGRGFGAHDLQHIFSRFGTIIHSRIEQEGTAHSLCFVSFYTRVNALSAVRELNGKLYKDCKLRVEHFEPEQQDDFRLLKSGDQVLAPHQMTEKYRLKRLAEVQPAREEAEKAETKARQKRITKEQREREAEEYLRTVEKRVSEARAAFLTTQKALAEAKTAFEEVNGRLLREEARYDEGVQFRTQLTTDRIKAERVEHECTLARQQAEHEESVLFGKTPSNARAKKRESGGESTGRDSGWAPEQQEQIREELIKIEELEKRIEQLVEEERHRPANSEEGEEAGRLRAYKVAEARERLRCQKRDLKCLTTSGNDTLEWFKGVSTEFDDTKFGASQPLTFGSIPWPVLALPQKMTFTSVKWDAVGAFFAVAKDTLGDEEFKVFVEKAHRRFHPDRWRSRGLLATILDADLQKRIEDAVNIVAQALTPIWQESKA